MEARKATGWDREVSWVEPSAGSLGTEPRVLDSSHKDPKLRCPLSSPAGFGLQPGGGARRTRDDDPEVSAEGLGWARGPVRDACGSPGDGGDREETEQRHGGPGAERGPGGLPPPPPLGWLGPLAPGPWPCLTPRLGIPLAPSQHSAALPLPPLPRPLGKQTGGGTGG